MIQLSVSEGLYEVGTRKTSATRDRRIHAKRSQRSNTHDFMTSLTHVDATRIRKTSIAHLGGFPRVLRVLAMPFCCVTSLLAESALPIGVRSETHTAVESVAALPNETEGITCFAFSKTTPFSGEPSKGERASNQCDNGLASYRKEYNALCSAQVFMIFYTYGQ